jgi:hypothetical protein
VGEIQLKNGKCGSAERSAPFFTGADFVVAIIARNMWPGDHTTAFAREK